MRKLLGLLAFGLVVVSVLAACGGQGQQEPGVQVIRLTPTTELALTKTAMMEVKKAPPSTPPSQTPEATVTPTPLCAISGSYDPDNHWQIICSVVRGKEYFVVVIYDVGTKADALAATAAFEAMAKRAGVDLCELTLHYVYPKPILVEMTPEESFPTGCVGKGRGQGTASKGLGGIPMRNYFQARSIFRATK
jgi:hypothetical protein